MRISLLLILIAMINTIFPNAVFKPEESHAGKTDMGGREKTFMWCLKCNRAYPFGYFREWQDFEGDVLQMCPYDGCNGDAFGDAWTWESAKKEEYPKEPKLNTLYPMY